jgi:hypothetical protein
VNNGMNSLKGTDLGLRQESNQAFIIETEKNTIRTFGVPAEFLNFYVPSDVRNAETSSKYESV